MAVPLEALLLSIPHRPPWSLIDRVVSVEPGRVVAEKRLAVGDPLLGAGLRGPLCIEALAQAAACLMVARVGGGEHRGYLVAAAGWKFPARALPGELVRLEAVLRAELGGLQRFDGRAAVDGREIAAGSMTFAVQRLPPAGAGPAGPA